MILEPTQENIRYAADLICSGEVVALPTETVYGLACDALNSEAVQLVYSLKSRPKDNPLICHFVSLDQIGLFVHLDEYLDKYPELFKLWPGPLTVILPVKDKRLLNISSNKPYLGVRVPANDIFLEVAKIVDKPLAAPSANKSGYCSPTQAEHVERDFEGKVIVLRGPSPLGIESTIVSLINSPKILRLGLLPVELVAEKLGVSKEELLKKSHLASPGSKYTHYSPSKPVLCVKDKSLIKSDDFVIESFSENLVKNFYSLLREADLKPEVSRIVIHGNLDANKFPDYVIIDRLKKMGAYFE